MNLTDLQTQLQLGEDSCRQFKADIHNVDSLASEMAAFANANGGTIYIGISDDGTAPGLSSHDVSRLNQLISNAATQGVRSPLTVQTRNIALGNGRLCMVVEVPKGLDKPYFDKNGVIWMKAGSDKRRIQSKEELRRLFQLTEQFHADELPTKVGPENIDRWLFGKFLKEAYRMDLPQNPEDFSRLLKNMNLLSETGKLNLAGLLLFTERPEWMAPAFVIKSICFPGNEIHSSEYSDSEDFAGPLAKVFEGALAFISRNLRKVQAGRGVNSPGQPEIPLLVFEELLVNALVHRDYLVSAPIRLFIYDNRIEIISPGHLPNNLSVEKILAGNSNIRNPIIASFVAKGILPYHGLGSGIMRAMEAWPDLSFVNDQEGCLFTSRVSRRKDVDLINIGSMDTANEPINGGIKPIDEPINTANEPINAELKPTNEPINTANEPINAEFEPLSNLENPENDPIKNFEGQLLNHIKINPNISYDELATLTSTGRSTVMRHIRLLKEANVLKRIGPKKSGHWEILKQP